MSVSYARADDVTKFWRRTLRGERPRMASVQVRRLVSYLPEASKTTANELARMGNYGYDECGRGDVDEGGRAAWGPYSLSTVPERYVGKKGKQDYQRTDLLAALVRT